MQVYREADVLIACRGKPILIGKWDERGHYHISLMQTQEQWQPRKPSKEPKKSLQEANRVYNFPTTEEAVKWMHAVCGYPVKSKSLKAIKAGKFIGSPVLNKRSVVKYYPETTETPKVHLNQNRKNVWLNKPKTKPFEKTDASTLRGRKV